MLPFITINIIDINVFLFGLIQIFASLAHQFHHQNWDQSQLTKVVGSSALLLVRVVLLDHSIISEGNSVSFEVLKIVI